MKQESRETHRRDRRRWIPWILVPALLAAAAWRLAVWEVSSRAAPPDKAAMTPAKGSAASPSRQQAAAGPPKTQGGVPAEHSYRVAREDIERVIVITGELKAARSREITVPRISSAFNCMVTFLALEGTTVKQGERIAEFDSSALSSQKASAERRLDETKLRIEMTKANLEAQRADLLSDLATAEGNLKIAQLYGKIDKSLLPANQFQKYQLDLEKAQLSLQKAQERLDNHDKSRAAQISLAEVDRDQALISLKKIDGDMAMLQMAAPQDGVIVYGDNWASNRKVQVGDNLFPGQTVISLPDLSSLQVVGFVYDTEYRYLSSGMVCDLSLDAAPGVSWRGRLVSLTSVASRKGFASQHKVFRATVQPDAIALEHMKPGATMRIAIPVLMVSKALVVPRAYMGLDGNGSYYVIKGTDRKTAINQPVQTGAFNDTVVEVVSGLNEGDSLLEIQSHGGGL